jgi:hypothetical protein
MDNRILRVEVCDHSLAPAAAEVRVVVRAGSRTPATALRGRLTGPRCPFASTVEVAYPLRPVPAHAPPAADTLVARVVIPEASLWDPQSPFLYGGPVELWEGDRRCDVVQVRHGLRQLRVGPGGVSVNGRTLALRGMGLTAACTDDDALRLRRDGYNLLVAPVSDATAPLWDVGDRLGFLVAGRVDRVDDRTRALLADLRRHPSCLGWLTREPDLTVEGALPADTHGLFDSIG